MIRRLAITSSVLLFAAYGQNGLAPLDLSKFVSPNHKITKHHLSIGTHSIVVAEIKAEKPDEQVNYCTAYVSMQVHDVVKGVAFEKIEPVGWHYGVFVIPRQPDPDYAALIKLGDYDGRLLLVNRSGQLFNLEGGAFFVDRKYRLLFSNYMTDDDPKTIVFDFARGRVVAKAPVPVHTWYRNGSTLYFTPIVPDGTEDRKFVYIFDMHNRKFLKKEATSGMHGSPVKWDFDVPAQPDCDAGPTPSS